MTNIILYQNKRNEHKYIEVHNDGHYHNTVRQYIHWNNGVKNLLGDCKLHRWKKRDLDTLLEDYVKIQTVWAMPMCKK